MTSFSWAVLALWLGVGAILVSYSVFGRKVVVIRGFLLNQLGWLALLWGVWQLWETRAWC